MKLNLLFSVSSVATLVILKVFVVSSKSSITLPDRKSETAGNIFLASLVLISCKPAPAVYTKWL